MYIQNVRLGDHNELRMRDQYIRRNKNDAGARDETGGKP